MTDMSFLWVALAVVAIILLAPRLKSVFRTRTKGGGWGVDVEGDLLRACGGDKSLMERLIQAEKDRKADLSRTGAALMALSRLRDDKR